MVWFMAACCSITYEIKKSSFSAQSKGQTRHGCRFHPEAGGPAAQKSAFRRRRLIAGCTGQGGSG
jgi:hypothetical protein